MFVSLTEWNVGTYCYDGIIRSTLLDTWVTTNRFCLWPRLNGWYYKQRFYFFYFDDNNNSHYNIMIARYTSRLYFINENQKEFNSNFVFTELLCRYTSNYAYCILWLDTKTDSANRYPLYLQVQTKTPSTNLSLK